MRTNLFHIVLLPILLTTFGLKSYSQELPTKSISLPAEKQKDSLHIVANTLKPTTKDTVKKKTSLLDGKIKYKAKKYAKINQKKKQITLYDNAEVYYKDIELKSGIIVIDYEKNEVYAGKIKDSVGKPTQYPYFKQGQNVVEPDSIRFNYKTKKALIWNSRTDQGEFKVKGEITKRENDSTYFIKSARFTTSQNLDNPEYYFLARKIKLVPKKKVVAGFTNMVIEDVPTPIAIPFAFFPMTDESTSGILFPTFGQTNQQGYFLQNGGYYFAISKKIDLALLGDYYTNGSYAFRAETNYAQRYKYRGNFNFRYENQITGERGLPGYGKTNLYNIQWTHSPDSKATPNSRFSASVNMGSSKYFQSSFNQLNTPNYLNNTLNSSISYSKTFNTQPQVNVSLVASHSQITNTGAISMTLPTLQANVDRVFPFAKKDGVKKGLLQNINFNYSLRGENRFQTVDSLFFKSEMFKQAKNGLTHSIPINTNFKVFKYFNVSGSSNYNETWYFKTIRKNYDAPTDKIVETEKSGFAAYRTYDFSSSVGTTIYGTFKFKDKNKIQAIRHVMRPSASYSYMPSFNQFYTTYIIDANGNTGTYSKFEKGIYGSPSNNNSSSVGLSLSNTFEAKVRDKDSTKVEPKKIMLLNNLNLSTSYNIKADSLNWSPLRVSGGTRLLKDKMDINFGMTLNPYAINAKGQMIDMFNINNGGSLFRMTDASMMITYSFSSKDFEKNKKPASGVDNVNVRSGGRADDLFGKATDFGDRRKSMFDDKKDDEDSFEGFYNLTIPWDLRFAYSFGYTNNNRQNEISQSSLMFSGNVDITTKWKMGLSSGYDFVRKGITATQLRFERDLLSWRMDFQWYPIGDRASWYFFIGVKSSVLSDIKWDKRSLPDRRL